jgi:membrane fusion protein (multidrug efflux system)
VGRAPHADPDAEEEDAAREPDGDLLFRIDPREFRAALQDARGQLGRAEAALTKSRQDVARYGPLSAEGAVSRKEYDDAVQTERANAAAVESGRAAVEQARLSLEWTEVRSPIGGVAGLSLTQTGDLVEPTTLLTTVSQLDPIKVTFPMSEREYLRYATKFGQHAQNRTPADETSNAELVLADGSVYPESGRVVATNREVDQQTGAILVQAAFPTSQLLRPASSPAFARSPNCGGARSSFRNGRCRSCRGSIASPSSATTTRSRSAPSRSGRAPAATG